MRPPGADWRIFKTCGIDRNKMPCPVPPIASDVTPVVVSQSVNIEVLKMLYANRTKLPFNKVGEEDFKTLKCIEALYKGMILGKKTELSISYNLKTLNDKSGPNPIGILGWGRIYGSICSLENASREIRGSLCEGLYHDIDIVNCHGVLIHQYAKRYLNYDMVELDKYNKDRKTYLSSISEDRDEAKIGIFKIFYNGGYSAIKTLSPMADEMKILCTKLKTESALSELLATIAAKKEKGIDGSFLSQIIQSEEKKCLDAMIKGFTEKGWAIGTLIYDGLHIRIRDGVDVPLKEMETFILSETGYAIELSIKEFETVDFAGFEAVSDADPFVVKDIRRSTYLTRKADFEKSHFYLKPVDSIVCVAGGRLTMYGREHAEAALGPDWAFRHSSLMADTSSFIKIWLSDPERAAFDCIGYIPDGSKMFIRPIEYICDRYKAPTVSILSKFDALLEHVSDRNPVIKEYLIKWFARMIQKPTENASTAIIVTGEQGVGKDMLGEIIGRYVLGMSNFADYTSSEQFWEKHDCGTEGKIFVKLQEAVGYLAHKNAGRFKARITTPRETYNPKGSKAYECDNLAHYYLTTNEASPVKIERTDRRFVLIRAGNYKRGDKTFWDDIWNSCTTNEAGAEIAGFLRSINIEGWNPSAIPEIAERLDAMEIEEDVETKFLTQWSGEECSALELYEQYRSYCGVNHYGCGTNTAFGRKLLPHIGRMIIKRKGTSCNTYKKA